MPRSRRAARPVIGAEASVEQIWWQALRSRLLPGGTGSDPSGLCEACQVAVGATCRLAGELTDAPKRRSGVATAVISRGRPTARCGSCTSR